MLIHKDPVGCPRALRRMPVPRSARRDLVELALDALLVGLALWLTG